jgi:hypothetical protein
VFTDGLDEAPGEKPSISGTSDDLSRFRDHPGSVGDPTGASGGEDQEGGTGESGGSENAPSEGTSSGNVSGETPVEPTIEPTADLMNFISTYRFSRSDIGFTPEEVFQRMEDEENEPDEKEEEILDAVLFDGYYGESFELGSRGRFRLVTHSPRTTRHCMSVLQAARQKDDAGIGTLSNVMMVARNLAEYMGRPTCNAEPGTPEFASRDAVEQRYNFCLDLSQAALDAIGARLNQFIERTNRALTRNLENFS